MCLHGALCSIPINLICNMTTFRKKIVDLWPCSRGRGCVKGQAMCLHLLHLSFPLIWYATWPCSAKVQFWPLDHTRGVYIQTTYYHVAACVIPLNLICNMTIFWKSWIMACVPPLSPPMGGGGGRPRPSNYSPVWYVPLFACKVSVKNTDNWVKYIAKFTVTVMFIYRHLVNHGL